MPFKKKTIYKRKRRSFKRMPKRSFKKRSSSKTYNMMSIKCDTVQNLQFRAATGAAEHVINWRNEGALGNTTTINDCAEWNTFKGRFRQFKLTYTKFRIDMVRSNNTAIAWGNIDIASRVD